MFIRIIRHLPGFMMLLALSACGGAAFSPESAAMNMLSQHNSVGMTMDQDSLKIRQVVKISDNQAFVLLTFHGTRPQMGPVSCIHAYETRKNALGWTSGNGGGTCRQDKPDQKVEDLEIDMGHYSDQQPGGPGYTQIIGYVNNPEIEKVRVTWNDNVVTEVKVIESTIIVLRSGDFTMQMIEGLNGQDEELYSFSIVSHPSDQR